MLLSILLTVGGALLTGAGAVVAIQENNKKVDIQCEQRTNEFLNNFSESFQKAARDNDIPDEIPDANYDE